MKKLVLPLFLLILLCSCSLFEKKSEVIAQVDDIKLTLEEFKSNYSDKEWNKLTDTQKKEFVQQWVNLVLLSKEAREQGLDKEKVIKNRIKYAEDKILSNALISSRLQAENITEEEMFNFYRIHQGDFSIPIMNYKIQRIFMTDNNALNRVRSEIMAGMKFEDAAIIYSQEEIGRTGGYMGTVTPDGVDSVFWQAVQKVNLYELTTLQKDNGYFLLRSLAEEPGKGAGGFDELKDEIRRRMLEERRRQVYEDLLRELKSKSEIFLMI